MGRNTKFSIDLDTGNFIVSSDERIYEDIHRFNFKVIESYFFQSEWDFENNLITFTKDGEDATPYLHDKESPLHKLATDTKSHHFGVMRYERM